MHVRPITRADLPALIDVAVPAFGDDALMAFLHPFRHDYPLTYRDFVSRRIARRFVHPAMHGFACVTDDRDPEDWPRGHIVGYAWWLMSGAAAADSPAARDDLRHNCDLRSRFEMLLSNLHQAYVDRLGLMVTSPPGHVESWLREAAESDPLGRLTAAHWHLDGLGVHPRYQRKGVGATLLRDGLDKAERGGNLPTTLVASGPGHGLYRKNGFRVVDWANTEQTGSFDDGACMIHDPRQRFTRPAQGDERYKEMWGVRRPIQVVWK